MKRQIVLWLLLAGLLLGGCGRAVEEAPPAAAAPPAHTPAPTETPGPAEEAPDAFGKAGETFPYDYFETLADTEDFALSVTALGVDAEGDWVVHLRLENRSGEIMNFRFLYQSVNGLAIADQFSYRVAVGGVSEPCFRILKDELNAWGFEEPVQRSFTLQVSSAESNREDYFLGELSASPFGQEKAVRYEFAPGPRDYVAMDNEYATVYVTGWQLEEEGLGVDYVAVSKCGRPLRLVLPERKIWLGGAVWPAELGDSFGAYTTLLGYIPVASWSGEEPPEELHFVLALADPTLRDDPIIEDTETEVSLRR